MASQTYTTLKAFQDAVNNETNRIAVEVQKLLDAVSGGLTPAEADSLIAEHAPLVARLEAIAAGGATIPDPGPQP